MDLKKERARLLHEFDDIFGPGATPRVALAPGRVNLIGEHTDYNGGLVLPMAIDLHTAVVFGANRSESIAVYANTIHETDEFLLDDIARAKQPARQWTNYIRGMAWALSEAGVKLKGGNFFIDGDLPVGAGLSSSASIEIATGLALLALAGETMDPQKLALCGQRAEHEFAGVRCGIMDQTAVACAKAGHALLLDCQSLKITHIPINLKGYSFAVFDTGVRHKLASSEYNKRRAECERAAKRFGRKTLRDATLDDMLANIGKLTASEEKRVRHVLTENLRTAQFASALKRGEVDELGLLLKASHLSLMEDYQVSCAELDRIVFELALPGAGKEVCPGARMTGGGFGGSVVALMKTAKFSMHEKALGVLAPLGGMILGPGEGARVVGL